MDARVTYDPETLRARLARLQWGEGLTRDEIQNQAIDLSREPALRLLPADFLFPTAGAVISYLRHVEQTGVPQPAPFGAPRDYPAQSPTGRTVPFHPVQPSVGSGAESGDTGSSYQTGVGRAGTSDDDGPADKPTDDAGGMRA